MENSNQIPPHNQEKTRASVFILRWGHRPQRDVRLTSHVALSARALGASGFILSDTVDNRIQETITKITESWGGQYSFEMGTPWKKVVRDWKNKGGIVVHLTVYGENVQLSNVLQRIRNLEKDLLIIVGSQKVPREFYTEEVSDFNVAVGNQPHSECAALAIFLDRFYLGETLGKEFQNAKMKIIPQERGKKVE